jgi:hypothetical protein
VTKLARFHRDHQPLDGCLATASKGDLDLLPVAAVLWLGSVVRVTAGALEHEVLEGEASLALFCSVLIPFWALRAWSRAKKTGHGAKQSADDDSSGVFTKP